MNKLDIKTSLRLFALSAAMMTSASFAGDYKVTITNLSKSQVFTPILVASHAQGNSLFEPGQVASPEITRVAEGGDITPLQVQLDASDKVRDTVASEGLLLPGKSVSLTLTANKKYKHFSLVSMLIPTNDAIVAMNDVKGPKKMKKPVVTYLYAWDAGTEINDESCSHIPGPVCGGEPFSDEDGEGFIHIHSGIKGIGDLPAETYDWNNPVAKVTIERMN